jgi:RNA polymerase primary sigma factor
MRSIKITNKITNREGSFKKYLNDISEIEVFTIEEEAACSAKASNGDKEAINELVKRNLRFVVSIAKQYENPTVSLEDLINEGNIGLIMAAQNYKPNTGFKFITYAVWWVRKLILEHISKNGRLIRIPANKVDSVSKYTQKVHKMEQKYGKHVTASDVISEELSNIGEMEDKEIKNFIFEINELEALSSFNTDSLDYPIGTDESSTSFYETISDTNIRPTDHIIYDDDMKIQVQLLLKNLKERDREIMIKLYGLNGVQQMQIRDVAKDYNLTNEMVRQINLKSLKKLRNLYS